MKSSQNVKVNRNTYSTLLGNYSDEKYTYENWGRGKNTRQTTAVLEETLRIQYTIKIEYANPLNTNS